MSHHIPRCVLAALSVLLLAFGLSSASSSEAAPRIVTISPRIDATGRTDVSARMAAFFGAVPDGSVVELARNGRYRMDQTLVLSGRHNLKIEGNGALFFARSAGDAHRSNVRIQGSSGIVIFHLAVRGANPHGGVSRVAYQTRLEHQHGFEVLSSSNIALVGVTATDVYGDFVYLGRASHGAWTNGVLIFGSHFARNGRQGITLVAARNVDIERNAIRDVRMDTIDLEPNGAGFGVDHVTVRNNSVGAGRLLFVGADGVGPVDDVTISGNVLHGQALQIWVESAHPGNRTGLKILHNTSDKTLGNPHGAAMRIRNVKDAVISGNTQPFERGRHMVIANVVELMPGLRPRQHPPRFDRRGSSQRLPLLTVSPPRAGRGRRRYRSR